MLANYRPPTIRMKEFAVRSITDVSRICTRFKARILLTVFDANFVTRKITEGIKS